MGLPGTHGFDFLRKYALIFGGLVLSVVALEALAPVGDRIEDFSRAAGLGDASGIVVFVAGLAVVIVAYWSLGSTVLAPWVATYLYILFRLRLDLTVDESRCITFCFDGSLDGKWIQAPRQLLKQPRDVRKTLLFALCNHVAHEHGLVAPFPELDAAVRHLEEERRQEAQRESQARAASSEAAAHSAMVEHSLRVLGVEGPLADFDVVRRAWRSQMQRYHPDRWAQATQAEQRKAEERAKALNAAYRFLEKVYEEETEVGR